MNIAVQTYSANANLQQAFCGRKTLLKTTTSKMELPGKVSLQKTLALTALLGLSTISMSALANNSKNNSQTVQVESVQSKQISSKLDSIIVAQDSIIEANNKKIAEMQLEIDRNNKVEQHEKIKANQKQQIENFCKWSLVLGLLSMPILAGIVLTIIGFMKSRPLYDDSNLYITNFNSKSSQLGKCPSKDLPTIGDFLMT